MTIILQSLSTGTGSSCAKPAGTVDGDCLVALFSDNSGAPATPTGWTLIEKNAGQFLQAGHLSCYRFASGEPSSYALDGSTNSVIILRYTGVATTGTVNGTAASALNTNACPSVTTSVADCLVVRLQCWHSGGGSFSTVISGSYTIETHAGGHGDSNVISYADNSGLPVTTAAPAEVVVGSILVRSAGTTTYTPASSSSGSQGTATWSTPAWSSGGGTVTVATFALTPA